MIEIQQKYQVINTGLNWSVGKLKIKKGWKSSGSGKKSLFEDSMYMHDIIISLKICRFSSTFYSGLAFRKDAGVGLPEYENFGFI